jgi:hypothetical protein
MWQPILEFFSWNLMIVFLRKRACATFFLLTFERNLAPRKKGFEYQPSFSQVWESIWSCKTNSLGCDSLWDHILLYVISSSDTVWRRVWKVAGCKFIKYLSPAIKLEGRQVIRVKWCCDCYPHCTGHCTSQQSTVGSSHAFSLTGIWV